MADTNNYTDGPSPLSNDAYDFTKLPDYNKEFIDEDDLQSFAQALAAPDASLDDTTTSTQSLFITALNDWRPVNQRVRKTDKAQSKKRKKLPPRRNKDETREGFVYNILKWPLLAGVMGWIIVLAVSYLLTRFYIFMYEHFVTMRGRREGIRKRMRSTATYEEWIKAASEMDRYLGNDKWKETDSYAYYNSNTIRRVRNELRKLRQELQQNDGGKDKKAVAEDLRILLEASVKDNFVGVENSRLYSETFYGTKNLVQDFVDEVGKSLEALSKSHTLSEEDKGNTYTHLYRNYGRTALCLSGGATFAYYHFGVAKALIDADVMPEVVTGTSGGALVAALLCTRTDAELKQLLVPALANRIRAASEPMGVWIPRWYRTGARFDSVDWARRCSWFCRGSLTFREAYERTGRILNVTCIPSDPHSPTVLANYLTAPDCVIWSAVLASAAVPGILNPVVLMKKNRGTGKLEPYSFGAKWRDGSLRTDIPLKALNTHFNVNFSIVSQVNPHINLFFFSSRGTVGRPVTHRRGRGWRGGFLGSATEQYLKLDLTKWLKVLRHLELLPRFVGQDWSEIWLQRFSGTVTIWPRVKVPGDFIHILSDPPPERLARMIQGGQQSAFPKIKFIANRMKIERKIEAGLKAAMKHKGLDNNPDATFSAFDHLHQPATPGEEEDFSNLIAASDILRKRKSQKHKHQFDGIDIDTATPNSDSDAIHKPALDLASQSTQNTSRSGLLSPFTSHRSPPSTTPSGTPRPSSPSLARRLGRSWWSSASADVNAVSANNSPATSKPGSPRLSPTPSFRRRSSVMEELARQSRVFFDDADADLADVAEHEHEHEHEHNGNATASDAETDEERYGHDGGDDEGPLADIDIGAGEGVLGRTLQTMDVGVERALARGVRAAGGVEIGRGRGAAENVDPLLETAGASGDMKEEAVEIENGDGNDDNGEYATPLS